MHHLRFRWFPYLWHKFRNYTHLCRLCWENSSTEWRHRTRKLYHGDTDRLRLRVGSPTASVLAYRGINIAVAVAPGLASSQLQRWKSVLFLALHGLNLKDSSTKKEQRQFRSKLCLINPNFCSRSRTASTQATFMCGLSC